MRVRYSEWCAWADRGDLPRDPGVYRIAKGRSRKVIYIGKTCGSGGLRGRVADFDRSANTGKRGHTGGVKYRENYGYNLKELYVETRTYVIHSPKVLRAYILYAERKLILEHVTRTGRLPICNSE